MSELKGSKTEQNLQAAFAGESQANRKYTYYAAAARKAGLNKIADYFEETALNESAHAKIWFKLLQGGDVNADVAVNLKDAAAGEHYENTTMYPEFAATAAKYSNANSRLLGSALTAVTSMLVLKLRRFARYVAIRRLSSPSTAKPCSNS